MKENFLDILNQQLFTIGEVDFLVKNFVSATIVFLLAPFIFYLIRRFILHPYFKKTDTDEGRIFAITSLIKYFLYVVFFFFSIQSLGIHLSMLWAGLAALMVGVGLGLQQTFNDFASGIILLVEGSVKKGDWIEVGDMQGQVNKIGLRTSLITTRRNVSIIVPNSKITVDNVINLSHDSWRVRYTVSVGVAYGSEIKKIEKLLLESALRHSKVLKKPQPRVRFKEFGESSLNFDLLFWSKEYFFVEDVRSDIRFYIAETFSENNVKIPFPQRDIHIVSREDKSIKQ